MQNTELINLIIKSENELEKMFNKMLDEFLESIEGYKQLSDDGKAIAKIFTCMTILYKMNPIKSDGQH